MQNGKIKTCSLASIFFFFQQIDLANCIFTKLMNNKIIRNSTRNHVQVHFENSCPFYINQMIVIEKDTYLCTNIINITVCGDFGFLKKTFNDLFHEH